MSKNKNSLSEHSGSERSESGEDGGADPAEKNLVRSLAKGFAVLRAFTAERAELTLSETARAARLDNATAFRMLNTLVQLGLVARVSGTRRFRLTLACLDLGFNAIARSDLRTLARPLLRGLVGERIEAASVGVLDGASVVYVERVQAGLVRLGVDVRIGGRVPAYSTAIGQAILAGLPRPQQVAVLEATPRPRLTETTITELDPLLARLTSVRAAGFAVSDQETVSGLRVLAAAVTDADGVPLAGLSVATPAFAMPLEEFIAVARGPVVAAAAALSRALAAGGSVALPGIIRRNA
ncbi:MAG: IclR family transcriptional regulator [Acetobacteraceae bacterium]|jgi:IclR family pca regulon transcriptional regulator|nr:IclR family transcriptional regulator [Acetobacteraceae bacterium]